MLFRSTINALICNIISDPPFKLDDDNWIHAIKVIQGVDSPLLVALLEAEEAEDDDADV